jgi:glutamate racemase
VFDSGIGGLTVVRALREALPAEDILYLGDTARVPYGTRSADTVVRYARQCARMLAERGLKALVVACNTASAVAIDVLRVDFDLPVLGVIEPSARAAARTSRTGRVGVIGTEGTIRSGAYVRAIQSASTRCEVFSRTAPLLVPLVEEGWLDGDVPRLAVERYLAPLCESDIDTLVLGCTHYPVLTPMIATVLGALSPRPVTVVSSATAVAGELRDLLASRSLLHEGDGGTARFLATDRPQQFARVGATVFGIEVPSVELVDL